MWFFGKNKETVKFCKDCVFYLNKNNIKLCQCPSAKIELYDLVSGEDNSYYLTCDSERTDQGICGKKARNFIPKEL